MSRYRYLLVVGGLLVFTWVSLGPKSRITLLDEEAAILPPPALPLKSDLKTLATSKKTTKSDREVKIAQQCTCKCFKSKLLTIGVI